MDLRAYLEYNKINVRRFAHEIGYHYDYVVRVANKRQAPGRKFVQAVVKATKGQVLAHELFALPPEYIERPEPDPSYFG